MTLTGDDIALALASVQIHQAWWQKRVASGFRKKQLESLAELNKKLSAIMDHAYPYEHSDSMYLGVGAEPIMVMDGLVTALTREAALAAQEA